MSPRTDAATLGRRMAAAQGVNDDRPEGEWIAYGQACQDALRRGRAVPAVKASAALAPPPPPVILRPPGASSVPDGEPRVVTGRVKRGASAPRRPAADVLCSACGVVVDAEEAHIGHPRARQFAARAGWGLVWRYAMLGGLVAYAGTHAARPWLPVAGLLAVGLILGLWHRGWGVAAVWRALVLGVTAVYIGPMLPVYSDVLAGSLGALTLSPIVGSIRRIRS